MDAAKGPAGSGHLLAGPAGARAEDPGPAVPRAHQASVMILPQNPYFSEI